MAGDHGLDRAGKVVRAEEPDEDLLRREPLLPVRGERVYRVCGRNEDGDAEPVPDPESRLPGAPGTGEIGANDDDIRPECGCCRQGAVALRCRTHNRVSQLLQPEGERCSGEGIGIREEDGMPLNRIARAIHGSSSPRRCRLR